MALSGSCGNTFRTGYRLQIDWTATQNTANNTSTITATLYLISLGSSYYINASAQNTNHITIDGTTYNNTSTSAVSGNQKRALFTTSKTITHNADGTKTFSLGGDRYMNVTLSGTFWGTVTIGSTNFTLNTIPRASQPTVSASSTEMGQTVTIQTHRASTSFTHTLTYSFGSASGTIVTGLATDYTWTVPLDLAYQIPNATSGTGTITCNTYSGGTLIGTKTVNFTATVPSSIVPTVSVPTLTGNNLLSGNYVQNKSTVTVAISASVANDYGATISSYSTVVNGQTYTSSSFTTGVLNTNGTNTVSVTVKDSRGRSATSSTTFTVQAYANPYITSISAFRCNSSGVAQDDGTYVKATIVGGVSPVNNANGYAYKIQYKLTSDPTWSEVTLTNNAYTINMSTIISGFNTENSYDIRGYIGDYYASFTRDTFISTAFTTYSILASGHGIALGKSAEHENLFDVNFPLQAQSNTAYTSRQVHNVILSTGDAVLESMQDGDIWIKYV